MIDWSAWISTGSAVVSALMAGVTVLWPWHTRMAPDLQYERDMFSVTRESMSELLVVCELQRPRLLVRWRNDGDGTAYAVKIEGLDDTCSVRLALADESKPSGFDFVDIIGKLEPGESFKALILPTSTADVGRPAVRLDWKESPTRLKRGHRSRRVELPYPLQGKRPLTYQERILARHAIEQTAGEYGYPFDQFVSQMLGLDPDDLNPWSASDAEHPERARESGE